MRKLKIDKNNSNQRLDKFLLKYLNKAPKSFIYKMIRKKNIKLNNSKVSGNEILQENDILDLYLSEETIIKFMEEKLLNKNVGSLNIVFEDKNILIVNKPTNLLSQASKAYEDNLVDRILLYLSNTNQFDNSKESYFTPGICNRLDRNTSGLVISGKNLIATQEVNRLISENLLEKYYLTIVKGNIEKSNLIKSYHVKDSIDNKVKIYDCEVENSKKVITEYKPIISNGKFSLLEVKLITGKSHQIRAHLQSIGHPIIGDKKYGDANINLYFNKKFGINSQILHASKLVFNSERSPILDYLNKKEFVAEKPIKFLDVEKFLFSL